MMHKLTILFFFCFLIALPLQGQPVTATAEVSPSLVMLGSTAEYQISFNGTSRIPNMNTPRVEGLQFSDRMGTSVQNQFINGVRSVQTQAIWSFQPLRTGTFTIPGRTVRISGEEVTIPEARFEVVPPSAEQQSRSFLQLDLPEGPFYVGQAVPARLGLFVRDDLSIANIAFPERLGEAFLNSPFDAQPERTRTRIEGRIYQAFIWNIILTPIKAEEANLRFTQQVALQVPVRDSRLPDIFSFSRSRSEVVQLQTATEERTILPVPTEDRPEGYFDAIGAFSATAELSSRDLEVGQPLTLTISLEGTGNFQQMGSPSLPEWPDWRVYPPKTAFSEAGDGPTSGLMTFEYILMPQSEAISEVPELRLATFNPETRAFVSTVIEAEPVHVRPSSLPDDALVFDDAFSPGADSARVPDALLSIRPSPGSLRPASLPWREPLFLGLNGCALAACVLLGIRHHRRRRLLTDSSLARRQIGNRHIRKALQRAQKAAAANEAEAFYAEARYALQERLSHLPGARGEARSMVTSDCALILNEAQIEHDLQSRVLALLEAADAFAFAGVRPSREALATQARELENLLLDLQRALPK